MPDFLPRADEPLNLFCLNLAARLSADPERYHVPAETAAAYRGLVEVFSASLALATAPGTRTVPVVAEKNSRRAALKRKTRELARFLHAAPVTDADLIQLGLSPHSQKRRRIGRPDHAPEVLVRRVEGATATLQLIDTASPSRTGMPRDADAALVYAHAGDQYPADEKAWRFLGGTSRARCTCSFGHQLSAGTRVWIVARWTHRGKTGPMSTPVMAYIQHPDMVLPGPRCTLRYRSSTATPTSSRAA